MIIVLTVVFAVVAVIGAGAVIIANNLNRSGGQSAKGITESAAKEAIEKVKAMHKITPTLFDGCAADDCVNPAGGGCLSCSDPSAIYTNGDISYKIKISAITLPQAGDPPTAGRVYLLVTSNYKNIVKQATNDICLNYCSVANYNCDAPDGCGGSCGTCTEPETCGGGGTPRVCGVSVVNCSDISQECDDSCPNGSTCGGGVVIDEANNIVVSPAGCDGSSCNGGTDPNYQWDNDGDLNETRADDTRNGENNMSVLNHENYVAAYFCQQSQYYGFDDDWYLPAKDELETIYNAIQSGWTTGYGENEAYWSSTEFEAKPTSEVYIENFTGHELTNKTKDSWLYVRCLRRYGAQAPGTCNDINTECTAECQNGDMCGGGTVIDADQHIVASLADCDAGNKCCVGNGGGTNCEGLYDNSTGYWDTSMEPQWTYAWDETDGRSNMANIPDDPQYEASYYCETVTYFNYEDWYLPATQEMSQIINPAISQGWTSGWRDDCYWSSVETNYEVGAAYRVGMGSAYGNCSEGSGNHKQEAVYLRCLRRYK